MLLLPLLPGGDRERHGVELCPCHPPRYRFGGDLRSQALGLPIVKEKIAVIETARDTKAQSLLSYPAVVHDAAGSQGSPSHRDGLALNFIIDNFVAGEDTERIRSRFAVDDYSHHPLLPGQRVSFLCWE